MLPTGAGGSAGSSTGRDGYAMATESSYYMTAGRNLSGMLNGGPVTQFQLNEMIRSQQQPPTPQSGPTPQNTPTFPRR